MRPRKAVGLLSLTLLGLVGLTSTLLYSQTPSVIAVPVGTEPCGLADTLSTAVRIVVRTCYSQFRFASWEVS